MRVLVVANAFPDHRRPYYGAYVHSDVVGLREAGLDVDVLYVPGYLGRRQYARGALRSAGSNLDRYDVVHAYHAYAGVLARLHLRAPLVVTFVGDDLLGAVAPSGGTPPVSRGLAATVRHLAWLAAATITRSEEMARALPRLRRARNHVIPSGVDLERFGRLSRAEARRRLGWHPQAPVVLFPADPARAVKNFPLARAAVEALRRTRPDVRLAVAATLRPEDMPAAMAAADVVLVTSHREGSPNVVKEAMAEEVPIVAVPVGDVCERLAGVPGCHVCAPDPERLATILGRALDHGRVAGARATVAPLSRPRMVRRVIGVYGEVVR